MSSEYWHIYLIRTAAGHLYCGITTDVERRFREHQAGKQRAARYLRGKGPLVLAFSDVAGTRSQALKLEYRIKQLSRSEKETIVRQGQLPDFS